MIRHLRSRPLARPSTALRLERLEDREVPSAAAPTFDDLKLNAGKFDAHRVIVAARPGREAALAAVNPAIARAGSAQALGDGLFTVTLNRGVSVQRALAYFSARSWVRYASPDYTVSLTRTPNDPSFSSQWGLNNTGQSSGTAGVDIDAAAAWNVTTGSGRAVVAVIDTGVDYNHPDLAANMWRNPGEVAGNGRDDDGNGYADDVYGWNFIANNNNVMDDNGHGTHIAGVIGAVGHNGVGVSGVLWDVQIMALKFLDRNGSGSLSNAIKALNYAVRNGATVSNNSYAGGGFYQAFADAVAAAGRAGHIFVAAAGNDGLNTDNSASYPAGYNLDNIIAVAATDRNDKLASFSNYGARTVDLGAPGVSIYSTYKGGGYSWMSGTSMAAPFVAGAVALLQDVHPDWTYRQVISRILTTTDPVAALRGKTVTGGRLNIANALAGSTPPAADTSGPSVTAASFSGSASGSFNRVRLTFSEPVSAATFTAADVVGLTRGGAAVSGVTFTVTPVSGTDNQFDVNFTAQTTVGTYALTVGPDIRDLAGNPMNQNGNSLNGEVPGDRYTAVATLSASQTFFASGLPKAIPDLGEARSTITITKGLTIERVAAKLNVTHTYVGDLRVWLQSPAGTWVLLFDQRGGSGDNIGTTFDDRAMTPVADGTAPYTGWFKPEEALAALAGQNARGTWTLVVQDRAYFDTGKLTSWGLVIDSGGSGLARVKASGSGAALATAPLTPAPTRLPTAAPQAPARPTFGADFTRQLDPQFAAPRPTPVRSFIPTAVPHRHGSAVRSASVFIDWLKQSD